MTDRVRPVRILHLDDDARDTELMEATLRRDGIECEIVRVETRDAFVEQLRSGPDVIISDVSIPDFDGIAAQQVWAANGGGIPFIFLSGTAGDAVALERLRAGATDYILKTSFEQLPLAVRRALGETRDCIDRHEVKIAGRLAAVNEELAESERRFFDILDHSPAAIFLKDLDGRYTFVNRRCEELMGRPRHEVIGKFDGELFSTRLAEMYRANDLAVMHAGTSLEFEEIATENGKTRVFHSSKFPIRDRRGRPYALCGISTDITERKRAEKEVQISRGEDLRTLLRVILDCAGLMLDEMSVTDARRSDVDEIRNAGEHALALLDSWRDAATMRMGDEN